MKITGFSKSPILSVSGIQRTNCSVSDSLTFCQETFILSAQCESSLLTFCIAFIRLVKFNVVHGYGSGNLSKATELVLCYNRFQQKPQY